MMHKPSVSDILKTGESYYSLVVAVAKRARDIASEAELNGEIIVEKPVQIAVEQFARNEYRMVEAARGKEEL